MLIAQISDTHIVEKGRKTLGIAAMDSNLRACIKQINNFIPRPDLVLITGDITDTGSENETRYAWQLLTELEMPFFLVPGNHDNLQTLWQIFGSTNIPAPSAEFQNYVIEDFPVRMIGLDSTRPHAPGGELDAQTLIWLENCLHEVPDKPTLIFMHHPPVRCSVLETDQDGFIGAEILGEIVSRYNNIERIICGHVHLATHSRWKGTIISTSPGNGMGLGLDLTMKKQSEFYLTSPAFQLHHWTRTNNLITHTIHIQNDAGPYLFDEKQHGAK